MRELLVGLVGQGARFSTAFRFLCLSQDLLTSPRCAWVEVSAAEWIVRFSHHTQSHQYNGYTHHLHTHYSDW